MTDDVEEQRDIDVRVAKRIEPKGSADKDHITIISGKALDSFTKRAN